MGNMTYDIRDTMIEAIRSMAWIKSPYTCPVPPNTHADAEEIADTALSVIDRHLANEPRTKAETAMIEFAEVKAREMRDNGFLHASDRAIPREILLAFAEELK